jgi:glycosyltransferase involved in cell wall biosynthesis
MQEDLQHTYNYLISILIPPFWRFLWRSHDMIITLSKHMTDYYASCGVSRSKLTHIYNGRYLAPVTQPVSKSDLERIEPLANRYQVLGLVGFLTKRKGAHQLVDVLSTNANLALLVIGDGPEKEKLEKRSNTLKVNDRTCFLGYRTEPEKYLSLMNVYAMTSYSEGFPLVLIEAGLNKRSVVCSDTALFRELFSEEEVSFFELDDIPSLGRAIERALTTPLLAENLYHKIQDEYNVSHMAESHLATYSAVINP